MTKKTLGTLLAFTLVAFSSMNAVEDKKFDEKACVSCCEENYNKDTEAVGNALLNCINSGKIGNNSKTTSECIDHFQPLYTQKAKNIDDCFNGCKEKKMCAKNINKGEDRS